MESLRSVVVQQNPDGRLELFAATTDDDALGDALWNAWQVTTGGNWARLSGAQRALYLGLGLRAKTMDRQSAEAFFALSMRRGTRLLGLAFA